MAKYRVKEKNSVTKGNKEYKAGELVDLTEDEAAEMPWAVEQPEPAAEKSEKKGK